MKTLFSSSQCSDGNNVLPAPICIQDIELVTKSIDRALSGTNVSSVYIASDLDDQAAWQSIYDSLKIKFSKLRLFTPKNVYGSSLKNGPPTNFLIDLQVLTSSDIFIGNCISSFSAFVSRMRKFSKIKPHGKTRFLGEEFLSSKSDHDEL